MTTLQTSEVLDLSADEIQRRGWRQHQGWNTTSNKTGGLCLEGGIMAAMGLEFTSEFPVDAEYRELEACSAYQAVRSYLADRGGQGAVLSPFWWNDAPYRTRNEVIEVLRAAAAIERVKEAAAEPALLACPA